MLEVIKPLHHGYWKEDLVKDIMYLPTMLPIGRGPLSAQASMISTGSQTISRKEQLKVVIQLK
jgi:hypothetical protein